MRVREWWHRLMRRRELEAGLDDEMLFHIERQTEKNIAQGMDASEARRRALVQFGGVERMKERTRDEIRPALLEDVSRDVQYGVRALSRTPAFSLVAILTLGLGIGAATAVFSVVNGVLLRPLPYPDSDRIVRLLHVDDDGPKRNVSAANFRDWEEQSRSFSAMALTAFQGPVSVTGSADPNRANLTLVSGAFFDVMGMRPAMGRGFVPEEQVQNGRPAAIVSDAYWRQYLGGRRDLENVVLMRDRSAFSVVGVMPPGFDYPSGTQIWVPQELNPPSTSRTAHNYQAIGRLADHATVASAARELSTISRAMKARYGDETWMTDGTVITLQEDLTGRVRTTLLILLGAAGFLLVIAGANVSNLLLVRSGARRRELALRFALGASRWRVARQVLIESLVLCIAGAAVGVLLAHWGMQALLSINPGNLPRTDEVGVNWSVLTFAVLLSITIAMILGLIVTLHNDARDLRGQLTEGQRSVTGGGRQQRVRDALVVTQVALTLVLLTGAGLLARSFLEVIAVDPGYTLDEALVLDIAMEPSRDPQIAARQTRIRDELIDQLQRMPDVTAVGGASSFPLGGGWFANGMFLEMNAPDEIDSFEAFQRLGQAEVQARAGMAGFRVVTEDYFNAMRIPLIRGRTFEQSDAADAPHVAVISESLARQKWPDQDPIGRFVQFGNMDGDLRGLRIVGIVGDVREGSLEAEPGALLYVSARQRTSGATQLSIVVRGTDSPAAIRTAQQIVRQVDPELPVTVRTANAAFDGLLAARKFSVVLLGAFAISALILAAMGLYGVIAYAVAQRTREIGIRLALGANARSVIRTVTGRGALLAALGVGIGLLASLLLTRFVQGMLYGVAATDPLALFAVIALIATAVFVASWLPARRALRVPPIITLRAE